MRPFRRHRRNREPIDVLADPLPEVWVRFSPRGHYAAFCYRNGPGHGIHQPTGRLVVRTVRGWTPVSRPPDAETGPEDEPDWPAYAARRPNRHTTDDDTPGEDR